jgi:hypothetical protein
LTDEQLGLPQGDHNFPSQQVSDIPLSIKRQDIPAGHYTGAIYLTLQNAQEEMQVPVDLSVRIGPFLPLLLLLLGIILGRLVKYMQERGGPQSEALAKVYYVESRIRAEADPADKDILIPMVKSVQYEVYRGTLQTVTAELQAIEGRLQALKELRGIQNELAPQQGKPEVKEVLDKIRQARMLFANKQDNQAKTLLNEVITNPREFANNLITQGQVDPNVATATVPALQTAQEAAHRAMESQDTVGQIKARKDLTWRERLKDPDFVKGLPVTLFMVLLGFRAQTTLWLVRPLLYLILLAGLVAVGFMSLYVDKGSTFGAYPFADYMSLILWGLGADVAGRSLANLRGASNQP